MSIHVLGEDDVDDAKEAGVVDAKEASLGVLAKVFCFPVKTR